MARDEGRLVTTAFSEGVKGSEALSGGKRSTSRLAVMTVVGVLAAITTPLLSQTADATLYGALDLGSLGTSVAVAFAVNDGGLVVGRSLVPSGETHGFLWHEGEMMDLGTLGGPSSTASALNGANEVVGESNTATSVAGHAFLWESGVMTDITPNAGKHGASARDINELGQVVGTYWDPTPGYSADGGWRAFVWEGGSQTPLVPAGMSPATIWSSAPAINDAGQVVVMATSFQPSEESVFVWDSGVYTEVLSPRSFARAWDVNEAGQVVGGFSTLGAAFHAFLWDSGTLVDLTPNFEQASAHGVNDAGQVIGGYYTWLGAPGDSEQVERAFVWEGGVLTVLSLGGDWSSARGINNAGQVVGYGETLSGAIHAFLWDDGTMIDLGAVVAGDSAPYDINEVGQVVGSGSENQAYLWEPVTPQEMTGIITDGIQDLVNGGQLTQGQGNSLASTLRAAQASTDRGNAQSACSLLSAFERQVTAWVNAGRLSAEAAMPLLGAAQALMDEEGC